MAEKPVRKYYKDMDIYTSAGEKVRFMNDHGHDGEKENACIHLQEGAVYTLLRADVYP